MDTVQTDDTSLSRLRIFDLQDQLPGSQTLHGRDIRHVVAITLSSASSPPSCFRQAWLQVCVEPLGHGAVSVVVWSNERGWGTRECNECHE
jgi:hypothetical protein